MLRLLSEAGRSFLRAFVAAIVVLLPGVLSAPNLTGAYGLGVAALAASVVAGLKAVQVFVPQLSFASLLKKSKFYAYYVYLDSFARAFVGTLLTLWIGLLNAPDLSLTRSAIVAVLVAAVAAGLRALQGFGTKGDHPAVTKGFEPPAPVAPVVASTAPPAA